MTMPEKRYLHTIIEGSLYSRVGSDGGEVGLIVVGSRAGGFSGSDQGNTVLV